MNAPVRGRRPSPCFVVPLLVAFGTLLIAASGYAQGEAVPEVPAMAAPVPSAPVPAAPGPHIDSGDTAWLLTSSALVLVMTVPGLALFYGGLVRAKNVLNTMLQCFIVLCLVSVQWVLWGYSLAFGPDQGHLIGNLDWLGLQGVGLAPHPDYAATVPHQAFMVFQLMFAAITPALITGAFVERMRFGAFLIFILLWTTLIYDPLAHWVWGLGGWLRERGALDFAGGTVVHLSSGVAALACALVLGRRFGYGQQPMPPHNLPLTVAGAGLLWFGWFGFNAGSALAAGAVATTAFVATNSATAAAALAWLLCEWIYRRRPTVLGAASGAVGGLVAITPAAGFVSPLSALAIGAGAGVLCYLGVVVKARFGYDDALDAFAIHGVGGAWGALATGLFASKAVNPAGGDGLFFGNPGQLAVQLETVAVTAAFVFLGTVLLLKLVQALAGLRVGEEEELTGLDLSLHNEGAYALGGQLGGQLGGPFRELAGERPAVAWNGEENGTPARATALSGAHNAGRHRNHPGTDREGSPHWVGAPGARRSPNGLRASLFGWARAPVGSSRRPPLPDTAPASSPGAAPLTLREGPFALAIEADQQALAAVWERLCHDYPSASPAEFNVLYPYVFTYSDGTVRFNKGDPEAFRSHLQRTLALYGLDPVRVTVAPSAG